MYVQYASCLRMLFLTILSIMDLLKGLFTLRSLHETPLADLSVHGHPCAASDLKEATAIAPCPRCSALARQRTKTFKAPCCSASDPHLRWHPPFVGSRTMAAVPASPANLFGLHQYDGLTSFFGDQNFDYDGFVLPQVSAPLYDELTV